MSSQIAPLSSPDAIEPDPYPRWAELRSSTPVAREEPVSPGGLPSFVVYRHAEVSVVLRDAETYSSAVIAQGMREVWGPKIIVGLDPPDHHHHRALVSVAFRQRTLTRWKDTLVQRVIDETIDGFADQGQVDLAGAFTFEFPAKVIAGILGLPEDDYRQFQQWAVGIIGVVSDWDHAIDCSNQLRQYLETIVEERRRTPCDDLITDLVTAELDGEKLDDDEIYSFLRMLLPAGIETTYRSSGNLLYLLLTHPDQLEAVRFDRTLIPQAIEEALRYESPVLLTPRVATRSTALAGVDIPAGAIVTAMLGSANRDPEAHAKPEVFDIHRDPEQHVSFGVGPHLCLGMHLARLETLHALNTLLDRLPNLRLDRTDQTGARIEGNLLFRSPTSLPVTWTVGHP